MSNAGYAFRWLVDHGYSAEGAAGIVGNLIQESGVDPLSNQDGGPGRGIAQWSEGARWDTLVSWARGKGLDPNDIDTQLSFLNLELKQRGLADDMKNASDVRSATLLFMNKFEIPDPKYANADGRVQYATGVFGKQGDYKAGSMAGSGGFKKGEFEAALAAAGWPSFLIDEFPGLKAIFQDAVKGKWTAERFIGEVKNSKFYQNRSDDMLKFDSMRDAEKEDFVAGIRATLKDNLASMGVDVDPKRLDRMANAAARFGLNDSQIRDLAAKEFKYQPVKDPVIGGQGGEAVDQIKQLADQYGLDLSNKQIGSWTKRILAGDADVQGFKDFAVSSAKRNYGWLSDELDKGRTLADLADPYRQSMAQMLELNPEQVKLSDPALKRAMQFDVNGDGKTYGLMPQYKFEDLLRKDSRWQYTDNAKKAYSDLGMRVLQDFGVIA